MSTAFRYDSNLVVYFSGTSSEWSNSRISTYNYANDKYIINNTRYYYSEERPASSVGSYWHYVYDVPTIWS